MNKRLWLACGLLIPSFSHAAGLEMALQQLFEARLAGISDRVELTVLTPATQRPECEQPQLAIPGSARQWGRLSVRVSCGNERRFVLVAVAASGYYLTAAKTVPRGATINASSLTQTYGRLDKLPAQTLLDASQAENAIALRAIAIGQPVVQSALRQAWKVTAGQRVQVIASGDGFQVNSEGKVLNNAAIAQPVRVRMDSGPVVSGTVDNAGIVQIDL